MATRALARIAKSWSSESTRCTGRCTKSTEIWLPRAFEQDMALTAKMLECKDEFRVPEVEDQPPPTPERIAANQQKWGYAG